MNGILNVYKEAGFTSHDVVAKLRGICGQKKIGHTGTLDPAAVGVLPVCLGNATKLCDLLTDKKKEYVADCLLGVVTDTQDTTGVVIKRRPVEVSEQQVREAVLSFRGTYDQVPPMYSALKVNGKRLYELARAGKEVERAARTVTIEEIEILALKLPRVRFRVVCSKGTYIRSLCADIGQKLGCGGTMERLERTRVDRFGAGEALRLSEIEQLMQAGRLEERLVPVDDMFWEAEAVCVKEKWQRLVENGNALYPEQLTPMEQKAAACEITGDFAAGKGTGEKGEAAGEALRQDGKRIRVYSAAGRFFGLYAYQAVEQRFVPVKMFL